jgi:hypothetical protein
VAGDGGAHVLEGAPDHLAGRDRRARCARRPARGLRAQHLRVLDREVGGDEHLAEVAEHAAQVRRLGVGAAERLGRAAGVARREERQQHQLLEPRRAVAVLLEQEHPAGQLAHRAGAEEHDGVGGALYGPPARL